MSEAIAGAIILGTWAIGLFFLRFHRKTKDSFFSFFACAFWLLAIERLILLTTNLREEFRPFVYIVRLVAFLFILYAIYHKNRGATVRRDQATGAARD